MASKGKFARIQRAEEHAEIISKNRISELTNDKPILREERELSESEKNFGITHWNGYPMGKGKCHCGSKTFISGRGTHKGWSGISCCSCGNLMEACACGGRLPTKEQERRVINDENTFN